MIDRLHAITTTTSRAFARYVLTLAMLASAGVATPVISATAQQPNTLTPAERAAGWVLLFDGKTLDGWRASDVPGTYSINNGHFSVRLMQRTPDGEEIKSFFVKDGALVVKGMIGAEHIYYVGPVKRHDFKNFELKLNIKMPPMMNSGVYFHTAWQESGFPEKGYEVQVSNYPDDSWFTGSLWGIKPGPNPMTPDNEWYTMSITVQGKRVVTKINDRVIVDYTEEENPKRPEYMAQRLLRSGTFALQCHDRDREIHYRNIKVLPLP
jgi:ABC-type transport system substrate-binding protein